MGDGMTMTKPGFVPLEADEASPATKFTEQQALAWLTDNPNTGKTVREIAAIWGWSRTTTHRFLSRGTNVGQGANFGETRGTSGTSGTSDEAPEHGRVLGKTPSGTVVAAMPGAPYRDDFDWSPENGDVVVAPQKAIAVYRNPWGQVVIRAAASDYGEED